MHERWPRGLWNGVLTAVVLAASTGVVARPTATSTAQTAATQEHAGGQPHGGQQENNGGSDDFAHGGSLRDVWVLLVGHVGGMSRARWIAWIVRGSMSAGDAWGGFLVRSTATQQFLEARAEVLA